MIHVYFLPLGILNILVPRVLRNGWEFLSISSSLQIKERENGAIEPGKAESLLFS